MADRNLAVGLFVISAIVLGVVLAVWITGKRGTEPVTDYHVLITSDVSGLTLGGPVYFMGVQVGGVTDLAIEPGNPARVRVRIRVDQSTPVDTGTWATLAAQGITGVSVINLSTEPGDHARLRVAEGESLPVIPYRDTGFSALLSTAPAVLDKVDQLLANANALFTEENRAAVAELLASARSLGNTLAAREDEIAALPGSLEATMRDVRSVVERLDRLVAEAGPRTAAAIANLETATAELSALGARLDEWVTRHDADVQAFTTQGLGQVPQLVTETRSTVREMRKLMEELRNEPSRALYRPASEAIEVED